MFQYKDKNRIHTMSLSSRIIPKLQSNPSFRFLACKENHSNPWKWKCYADLDKAISQSRIALQDHNIQKGDRVAFKGNNSFEWIAWNLATNSLGAIWVPMYHNQNREYCKHIVDDCEPKIVLTSDSSMDLSIPNVDISLEPYDASPIKDMDFQNHSISTLIYTSGTTGKPKGVMLSNENIISNVEAIRKRFIGLPTTTTSLTILPWAHIYSQTCELYYSLFYENKLAIASSREDFIKECGQIQPATLYLVPRVLDAIKGRLSRFDKPVIRKAIPFLLYKVFGPKLLYIFTGGAKLNQETKDFFTHYGYIICEGYGCTETAPMISVNHFESPRDMNSIGKILDNVNVEIVNGEIQVSGPNVMQGYWNQDEATSQVLVERNGKTWYKTGDCGTIWNDFLYYEGRISENYKLSNGKFVNVQTVEECIKKNGIGNVVVFGENKDKNEMIVTEQVEPSTLEIINAELDSYLKIEKVHVITCDEWDTFLTPKMSVKRKPLIEYVEKEHK